MAGQGGVGRENGRNPMEIPKATWEKCTNSHENVFGVCGEVKVGGEVVGDDGHGPAMRQ